MMRALRPLLIGLAVTLAGASLPALAQDLGSIGDSETAPLLSPPGLPADLADFYLRQQLGGDSLNPAPIPPMRMERTRQFPRPEKASAGPRPPTPPTPPKRPRQIKVVD